MSPFLLLCPNLHLTLHWLKPRDNIEKPKQNPMKQSTSLDFSLALSIFSLGSLNFNQYSMAMSSADFHSPFLLLLSALCGC